MGCRPGAEPNREKGSPVNRDDESGAEQRRGAGRGARIHVAGAEAGTPAPDRQQSHI